MSLALASVLVGGLGSMYSQHRAGKQAQQGSQDYRQQMSGIMSGQQQDIDSLLAPDAYQNFMDTSHAQSVLESARGQMRQNIDQLKGNVARSGGTAEAEMAGAETMNTSYADMVNRLAGHGTQYRNSARRALMGAKQNLAGQQGNHAANLFGMSQDQAHNTAMAGRGFSQSMGNLGQSLSGVESIRDLFK